MMAPNWSNIKNYINNTFHELKREVNSQISREIKRVYVANPEVENVQWKVNNQTVHQKQKAGDRVDQQSG